MAYYFAHCVISFIQCPCLLLKLKACILNEKNVFCYSSYLHVQSHAQLNIMRSLYMAEKPSYAIAPKTVKMCQWIGEFGLVVAAGIPIPPQYTAKINRAKNYNTGAIRLFSVPCISAAVLYRREKVDADFQRKSYFLSYSKITKLRDPT